MHVKITKQELYASRPSTYQLNPVKFTFKLTLHNVNRSGETHLNSKSYFYFLNTTISRIQNAIAQKGTSSHFSKNLPLTLSFLPFAK